MGESLKRPSLSACSDGLCPATKHSLTQSVEKSQSHKNLGIERVAEEDAGTLAFLAQLPSQVYHFLYTVKPGG